MRGFVFLAAALSGLSLAAGTYRLRVPYRVFEPLGSAVAPAVTMPDNTKVYVFDGNKVSQQELLIALNAGKAVSEMQHVAEVAFEDDGCIYNAEFTYTGEPAGTAWPLYIACVWGNGIDSVFISPVAMAAEMAMAGVALPVTIGDSEELSKNTPSASLAWRDPADPATSDPSVWYLVRDGEMLTLRPWKVGGGTGETEVPSELVEGVKDFAELVRVESPEATAISDDDYRKYFMLSTSAQKNDLSGTTTLRYGATLDPDKVQIEKSAASFAAGFSAFAAGETEGVTLDTLPGLYYTVRFGSQLGALELPAEPGFRKLALGSSTELPLPRPKAAEGEPDAAFYRLVISAEESAK